MFLSVVIPVYNESKKIISDLRSATDFFKIHQINGEIIVVDDGSTDLNSEVVTRIIEETEGDVILVSYKKNRGKGYAAKRGILKARGDIIMFIDSGNCIPYKEILPGIESILKGETDISHASRYLGNSRITVPRSLQRRFFSWSFRQFIRLIPNFPRHLTDSQCGLKIYDGKVAHMLYSQLVSEGYLFDVEIILRATQAGYRISEFPVTWTPDPDSRLRPLPLLLKISRELKQIRNALNSQRC